MKKIITLAISGIIFYQVQAQNLSGGFRTGASMWKGQNEGKCFGNSAHNATWDKELFVRYQTKGKLAFEAGMGHYAATASYAQPEGPYPAVGEIPYYIAAEKSQNIEWNLSAQYDLTCPALAAKCPLMKRMKSYAGVILSPTLSRNTTERKPVDNYNLQSRETTVDDWALWTGLSHTMIYNLNEQLYVTSSVRLQVDPNKFFDDAGALKSRDRRMGLQIGFGYNLR